MAISAFDLFKIGIGPSSSHTVGRGCRNEGVLPGGFKAKRRAPALYRALLQSNAAEIGMEHHLGLTCDPVGGLVQIPCIERNAIASVKAINAARLALQGVNRPPEFKQRC